MSLWGPFSTMLLRSAVQRVPSARTFSALARSCFQRCLPDPVVAVQIPIRTFKDMDVLTKRCKDCYFKKGDDRWYVLCKTHGRHKQRQRLPDERYFWIVTHRTHGPKKRF